ncbi:hypothetical protein ACS0TY_008538 [Phlomoides rotata]
MANTTDDQSSIHNDDFSLKEWALKARITRENTNSRRFSASNLKTYREDATSFRSNVTVSSTASSPGNTSRDEIDPSTYSFTTALKALQARTVYTWEYQSGGDGLILNSKWNDAEKYICNPLSGEVPLECLSAKTLSARSFRSLTSRITMSAPLIYPSHMHQFHANPPISQLHITSNEKTTRDVGTQSTPVDLSSGSPSPARTPSIQERPRKMSEGGDSSTVFSEKLKSETEVDEKERDERERNGGERRMSICSNRGAGGCLSLRGLWRRAVRHRDKHKSRTNTT